MYKLIIHFEINMNVNNWLSGLDQRVRVNLSCIFRRNHHISFIVNKTQKFIHESTQLIKLQDISVRY